MIATRVIGHRGAAGLAPENTLAGIQAASRLGLRWVELDIRLLGDGTPVVCHDATVDRCSDGRGPLSAYNRQSIQQLDAGSWFGNQFMGERIPLLAEALLLIRELGLGVNLELKSNSSFAVERLIDAVLDELAATALPAERVLISSFQLSVMRAARVQARRLLMGCLWSRLPGNWQRRAAAVEAVSVHCDWRYLSEQSAHSVKAAGYDLYCYTVNDPQAFKPRWGWGIDGIFTDRPQDFLHIIR